MREMPIEDGGDRDLLIQRKNQLEEACQHTREIGAVEQMMMVTHSGTIP